MKIRRIVTGHDEQGNAVFVSDADAPRATAFKMRGVAPQRQIFGKAASCSGEGDGVARISAASAMMNPGSQRPHWLTCSAAQACCKGWARPADSPSIVVMSAPSAAAIVNWQDKTACPSAITVQLPQSPL